MTQTPPAIAPGYRVGSYELVQRIGAGSMGQVWLARHPLLERQAAVKLINPTLVDPEHGDAPLRRFEREARATGSLESPNTVRLYDFGVTAEGVFYYVMEHLRGVDLFRLVNLFGPLDPARAVDFTDQVCGSLAEAHTAGLVHRDVKPANIYVCELGIDVDIIKVLDFGLVRDVFRPTDVDITGGRLVGSPAFVSPEACAGQSDPRGDLYSLGCTLYFLLTGSFVFREENLFDMVDAHLNRAPTPPSVIAPRPLPVELDELVLDCLAKDPADRPESAREVRRRLRAIPLERPWTHRLAEEWWDHNRAALVSAGAARDESVLPGDSPSTIVTVLGRPDPSPPG